MKIRVGINGLGRIGKKIASLIAASDRFVVSVINDINFDCHNWCYILNYDTIYGNSPTKATFDGSHVTIKDSMHLPLMSPIFPELIGLLAILLLMQQVFSRMYLCILKF